MSGGGELRPMGSARAQTARVVEVLDGVDGLLRRVASTLGRGPTMAEAEPDPAVEAHLRSLATAATAAVVAQGPPAALVAFLA